MVVSAMVHPTDWDQPHCWQLAVVSSLLAYGGSGSADRYLDGLLSGHLAQTHAGLWLTYRIAATPNEDDA